MSNDRNDRNERTRIDELTRDLAVARRDLEARDATITALRAEVAALKASAEAPAVGGTQAWVLKVALKHNDVVYPPGAEVPFDPKQPPEGCNGLREGVHYHALHVLRAPLAAA